MTAHANPTLGTSAIRSSEGAGQLTFNQFKFDFADAAYKPAALAATDTIQIGVVPAGEKLVPQLCRIDVPALDSNGAPTGDYSIGIAGAAAALKASAASETAVTLFGEDFVLTTGEVGDRLADTPIYITIINVSATVPATGVIKAQLVSRPWDFAIDG